MGIELSVKYIIIRESNEYMNINLDIIGLLTSEVVSKYTILNLDVYIESMG